MIYYKVMLLDQKWIGKEKGAKWQNIKMGFVEFRAEGPPGEIFVDLTSPLEKKRWMGGWR